MFGWFTKRRRSRLEAERFPERWRAILKRNSGHYGLLDDSERSALEKLVQVFVAEKHWEGAGGLELDDEIKVTIAADACLLLLGREHDLYDGVRSIVVYPSVMAAPERARSFFDTSVRPEDPERALLGEAHLDGPVIVAWDAARRGARNPHDGRNVVIHELAHKIDMLDRRADGTPPLDSRGQRRTWATVAEPIFLELQARAARGEPTFLDQYGATDEAEFFAVATESFFERPLRFQEEHPDLYELLADYYNQDPAARHRRGCA